MQGHIIYCEYVTEKRYGLVGYQGNKEILVQSYEWITTKNEKGE